MIVSPMAASIVRQSPLHSCDSGDPATSPTGAGPVRRRRSLAASPCPSPRRDPRRPDGCARSSDPGSSASAAPSRRVRPPASPGRAPGSAAYRPAVQAGTRRAAARNCAAAGSTHSRGGPIWSARGPGRASACRRAPRRSPGLRAFRARAIQYTPGALQRDRPHVPGVQPRRELLQARRRRVEDRHVPAQPGRRRRTHPMLLASHIDPRHARVAAPGSRRRSSAEGYALRTSSVITPAVDRTRPPGWAERSTLV